MADGSALIAKPRDYFEIMKLQEPGVLEDFFDKPLPFIVATVTGALAAGKAGWFLAGGRLVQGMLKGRLFEQWSKEVRKFQEAGRIPDDFADTKYGFQTWVELMTIIDEESPDADRLGALKAMFFAVNKVGVTDGERIKAYQLWQIAKQLSSGELLLLRTVYVNRSEYASETTHPSYLGNYSNWASYMAKAIGHNSRGLIDLHEKKPTEIGLLTARVHGDGSGISGQDARLSELGLMFCSNIQSYEIEMRGLDEAEKSKRPRAKREI
jgi:hypothetical protein